MARPRMVKRMRRKMMGGLVDFRFYSDGTIRARCDHPSNDPEIEMAMAGRVLKVARETFARLGLPAPVMRPVTWNSDPPSAAAPPGTEPPA